MISESKKFQKRKIVNIISVCIISVVLSFLIHSVRAGWLAPTANPAGDNVAPPVYNETGLDPAAFAVIDRHLTVAGQTLLGDNVVASGTLLVKDSLSVEGALVANGGFGFSGELAAGTVPFDHMTGDVPIARVDGDIPTSRLSGNLILSNTTAVDDNFCIKITGHACGYDVDEEAEPVPVPDLVNGQHFDSQCTGLGGEIALDGSDKFCKFNSAGCPTGWAQYKLWSTTTSASDTCNGICSWIDYATMPDGQKFPSTKCVDAGVTTCTAEGHTWSNAGLTHCAAALPTCPSGRSAGCSLSACTPKYFRPGATSAVTHVGCY